MTKNEKKKVSKSQDVVSIEKKMIFHEFPLVYVKKKKKSFSKFFDAMSAGVA